MNTAAAAPLKGHRFNFWPFSLIWRERITPPDGQRNARRYLYGVSLWGGSITVGWTRTVER